MSSADEPWFSEGVKFTCQPGCVRCCGGAPGDVFVNAEEIAAIAAYFQLPLGDFDNQYVRHYSSGRMSLKERRNGDCVLLSPDGKGCSVYPVRPKQCRDYPLAGSDEQRLQLAARSGSLPGDQSGRSSRCANNYRSVENAAVIFYRLTHTALIIAGD